MVYVRGDLNKPELYDELRSALEEADKARGTKGNAIFYLAVADRLFGSVVQQLGKAKLTDQAELENGKHQFWRRVVIEKPFGHSLLRYLRLRAAGLGSVKRVVLARETGGRSCWVRFDTFLDLVEKSGKPAGANGSTRVLPLAKETPLAA